MNPATAKGVLFPAQVLIRVRYAGRVFEGPVPAESSEGSAVLRWWAEQPPGPGDLIEAWSSKHGLLVRLGYPTGRDRRALPGGHLVAGAGWSVLFDYDDN